MQYILRAEAVGVVSSVQVFATFEGCQLGLEYSILLTILEYQNVSIVCALCGPFIFALSVAVLVIVPVLKMKGPPPEPFANLSLTFSAPGICSRYMRNDGLAAAGRIF
jgi:hypothetical protein